MTKKQLADKVYYAANREKRIAQARAWRLANPEKFRASARKHTKLATYKRNHADVQARRRAQKKTNETTHIDALVLLEMDDGLCGICGEDVNPLNYHIDHIVPLCKGGAHTYSNTQISHPVCNIRKGGRLL